MNFLKELFGILKYEFLKFTDLVLDIQLSCNHHNYVI